MVNRTQAIFVDDRCKPWALDHSGLHPSVQRCSVIVPCGDDGASQKNQPASTQVWMKCERFFSLEKPNWHERLTPIKESTGTLPIAFSLPSLRFDDAALRARVEISHVDVIHSGATGGFDADVGIFEYEARTRCDAKTMGGFKENVGIWLMESGVFGADDRVETVVHADCHQLVADDRAGTAAGDGHGQLSAMGTSDLANGLIGHDLAQFGQKQLFLFNSDGHNIDDPPLFGGKGCDDLSSRNASHRVESRLGKGESMPSQRFDPSDVVQRHGIGKCPVTVKNQPGISFSKIHQSYEPIGKGVCPFSNGA